MCVFTDPPAQVTPQARVTPPLSFPCLRNLPQFAHQPPSARHFSRIDSRAVVADFNGGRLTTDAGALLLRELGEKLGLFEALDRAIPDPRWLPIVVHDQRAMLAQRIIGQVPPDPDQLKDDTVASAT